MVTSRIRPLMAQLSIHSYSQLLMPPYTTTRKCEEEDNIDNKPCDQVRYPTVSIDIQNFYEISGQTILKHWNI